MNSNGRYFAVLPVPPFSGCTEAAKARELSEKLGVEIQRSMVVLAHSPMRTLAPMYWGKRVMVLGSSAKEIAHEDLGLDATVRSEAPTCVPP